MKNFSVYKSSAGSGKTYTLVKEYLLLCLGNSSPYHFSKILAITFTNKASEEMKMRILQYLKAIAETDTSDGGAKSIKQDLIQQLNLSKTELEQRAAACLTSILHNYADFGVSTIDKFSHKLVRTFAKDLGLSLNFKVELDEEQLLLEVVSNTIAQVGIDQELSSIIVAHVKKDIELGNSWDPSKQLLTLTWQLIQDSNIAYLKSFSKNSIQELLQIQERFLAQNTQFRNAIQQIGEESLALIKTAAVDPGDLSRGTGGIYGFFRKMADFNYKEFGSRSNANKTIEEDKWYSGKADDSAKAAIDSIKTQLKANFLKAIDEIETGLPHFIARSAANKYLAILSLVSKIEKELQQLKSDQRLVPISDFNKKIGEVVLNEPMPFIYERLGEKFDHILVDEFQDTSVMQFMNLLPLIEESLARGKRNLIVGDAKQAIYRFRGGEVSQFAEMPNYIAPEFKQNDLVLDRLLQLKANYEEHILKENFRSRERLVSFNNAFFEAAVKTRTDSIQAIFKAHNQLPQASKPGGYVDVKFLKSNVDDQLHEAQVLEDIQECLADGFKRSEIAILCRTKNHSARMAEFLGEHDIQIISSESLLLSSNAGVQFLVALSEWIQDQANYGKLKDLIHYLNKTNRLPGEFEDLLEKYVLEKADFLKKLADLGYEIKLNELRSKPIYELFESLIREFRLNDNYDAYLQFFMENVFSFGQKESNNLSDFLAWWYEREDKLSVEITEEIDAVQILTLHKSKGLEFPVVIYPYIGNPLGAKTDLMWTKADALKENISFALIDYNRELKDSVFSEAYENEFEKKQMDLLNETYVTLTRASKRMYLRVAEVSQKVQASKDQDERNRSLSLLFQESKPAEAIETDLGYFYGAREKESVSDSLESKRPSFALHYHSRDWRSKIRISTERSDLRPADSGQAARSFGNLFHAIMAKIDCQADIDRVLKSFLYEGEITTTQFDSIKMQVNQIVSDPVCAPFFQPGLKTKKEALLLGPNGENLRPDRVVFLEDQVVVLDYKTGEPQTSHHEQVQKYIDYIKPTVSLPIVGYLYYLDDFKAVELLSAAS